jgi:hypothetical protein
LIREDTCESVAFVPYLAFWAFAFSLFSFAQPSFTIWRALPSAKESGGTSSVTVVAAAM